MGETINKTIKFYDIIPKATVQYYGDSIEKQTYAMFKVVFPHETYYELTLNDNRIIMEILEYTDEYIFSKCSKIEDSVATNFLQLRNKNTSKTELLNLASEQLETFTFVYIDFKHNKMAVLSNKKISKINEYISAYINKCNNAIIEMSIIPLKISNLQEELKKYNRISALQIKYVPTLEDSTELRPLKEVFNEIAEIKDAKIKISILNCHNYNTLVDRLFQKFRKKDKNWEKFEIIAKNDNNLDEVINFYEAIYIKNVLIQIDEKDLKDFHWIRDKLKIEIQKIIPNKK